MGENLRRNWFETFVEGKEEKEEGVRAAAGKQTCSCEPAEENQSTGTQKYTAFEKDGNGSHGQWTFYQ